MSNHCSIFSHRNQGVFDYDSKYFTINYFCLCSTRANSNLLLHIFPFLADLTLKTICSELGTVSHKWMKIGIQLGIPHHVLKQFEDDSDPLSSAVNYWLKGNAESSVPISWKSIVAALKDSTVEEGGLAEKLSKKYCQPQDKGKGKISYSFRLFSQLCYKSIEISCFPSLA